MPKVKRSRKHPPDGWELIEPTLDETIERIMPKVKRSRKHPPDGWELIEPTLDETIKRIMPKVKRSRKHPPDGWELIEPTLDELDAKMREAETDPHEGKRKVEALWPIFRIHHQKSRYIFDLFYKRKAISRELYDYCLKENIADKNLIAKWKKPGYENLSCLRCIQTRDTNFATNCVCRVPKTKLEEGKIVECINCGCRGCSG